MKICHILYAANLVVSSCNREVGESVRQYRGLKPCGRGCGRPSRGSRRRRAARRYLQARWRVALEKRNPPPPPPAAHANSQSNEPVCPGLAAGLGILT